MTINVAPETILRAAYAAIFAVATAWNNDAPVEEFARRNTAIDLVQELGEIEKPLVRIQDYLDAPRVRGRLDDLRKRILREAFDL